MQKLSKKISKGMEILKERIQIIFKVVKLTLDNLEGLRKIVWTGRKLEIIYLNLWRILASMKMLQLGKISREWVSWGIMTLKCLWKLLYKPQVQMIRLFHANKYIIKRISINSQSHHILKAILKLNLLILLFLKSRMKIEENKEGIKLMNSLLNLKTSLSKMLRGWKEAKMPVLNFDFLFSVIFLLKSKFLSYKNTKYPKKNLKK